MAVWGASAQGLARTLVGVRGRRPSSWALSASWTRGPCRPSSSGLASEMKLLWKHSPGPGRTRVPWAAGPSGDWGPECRELKAGLTSEACGAASPEDALPGIQPPSSAPGRASPAPGAAPSPAGRSVPQPCGLRCDHFLSGSNL